MRSPSEPPLQNAEDAPISSETAASTADPREELVHRVASSSTFARSPRLQAFFLYVCQCALENKPEAATEQQIGINVYHRPPEYNPNEDNIVRSQARLLRMKLEHHFANEGKDEPVIVTIPKGRYLPVFEARSQEAEAPAVVALQAAARPRHFRQIAVGAAVLGGLILLWLGYLLLQSRASTRPSSSADGDRSETEAPSNGQQVGLAPGEGEIRIAAGRGTPYVDVWGRRWEADRYYDGGTCKPGPRHLFPPVADEGLFSTMREAVPPQQQGGQSQYGFRYDIPLRPGVYELRLYFADPLRQPDAQGKQDTQNVRSFHVNLNGRPLLFGFDPIVDAGFGSVDVRVFKDVSPASDGKLHLEFVSGWHRPFVTALEITPGIPGKLRPIRIAARQSDLVDSDGTRWSGDNYFLNGRTITYASPESGPKVSPLYTVERYGNFSYAIPVAPGSYTVRLHFMESFFTPEIPAAVCRGVGCRVFNVTCNGVMLLEDFDVIQAAGGAFRPVVREFRGLHPDGQGKLLISFSPKVNYAEVRAIEVIAEGK